MIQLNTALYFYLCFFEKPINYNKRKENVKMSFEWQVRYKNGPIFEQEFLTKGPQNPKVNKQRGLLLMGDPSMMIQSQNTCYIRIFLKRKNQVQNNMAVFYTRLFGAGMHVLEIRLVIPRQPRNVIRFIGPIHQEFLNENYRSLLSFISCDQKWLQ